MDRKRKTPPGDVTGQNKSSGSEGESLCKGAVQTFYRWRKEFGGLKLDQAKRLKEGERATAN
jgi:putative transposase